MKKLKHMLIGLLFLGLLQVFAVGDERDYKQTSSTGRTEKEQAEKNPIRIPFPWHW